jgi:SAM-dependent methyltransferase
MESSSPQLPSQSPSHDEPSAWVRRFAALIPAGGTVLDLACGRGRHARLLASLGYAVEAVDDDADALAGLDGVAGITTRHANLEGGPWPYYGVVFDGIVVTNYLHRPLLPHLARTLAEGGVMIYETFMIGNERFGKPSNPAHLLRVGELLELLGKRFVVVAFEQGEISRPRPAVVQRICVQRGTGLILPESV